MTDDERELLAFLAVKVAQIDAMLSSLAPIIIHLSSLRDDQKLPEIVSGSAKAYGALTAEQLKTELQFLSEQHPQMHRLFSELGSLSAKDAIESLRKFLPKKPDDPK